MNYLLLSLPVIAIIGALTRSTGLLMALVPLIILSVVLLYRTEHLPYRYYLGIVCISLALLYSNTLITSQLIGSDIHVELFFASQPWDSTIPVPHNAALSITLLAPFLSAVTGMSPMWVLKVIYPALFTLVPILMLRVFKLFAGYRDAFLAVFCFMAMTTYFTEIPSIARQMFAEIFMALTFLAIVRGWRFRWLVLFPILMAVSHYALTWVLAIILGGAVIVLLIAKEFKKAGLITASMLIMGAFSVIFFSNIAGGIAFRYFKTVSTEQVTTVQKALTEPVPEPPGSVGQQIPGQEQLPDYREPLVIMATGGDFNKVDWPGKAVRLLILAIEGVVIAGYLVLCKREDVPVEYKGLLTGAMVLMALCLYHPTFAWLLNFTRFIHIALIVMAPVIIAGLRFFLKDTRLILAVVAGMFLFTSGFVFEALQIQTTDKYTLPFSYGLSSWRTDLGGVLTDNDAKVADYCAVNGIERIYTDVTGRMILQERMIGGDIMPIVDGGGEIPDEVYIFLRERNEETGTIAYWCGAGLRQTPLYKDTVLARALTNRKVVYQCGMAKLYSPAY